MKLINKTILYYLLISLPLLVIAAVLCYLLVKIELQESVDETLTREKINLEKLIGTFKEPHNSFIGSDNLSQIKIVNKKTNTIFSDTCIYDAAEQKCVNYRVLKSCFNFNDTTYEITVFKPTLEEEELMEGLLSVFGIIIGFLVVAFLIVNYLISKNLWKPFYETLAILNKYDVKKHERHLFGPVKTMEFNQLNLTVNKMIEKIYADFTQQKEFTENASHEMQTPLAVVKANISLLLQSPNLKEAEMNQLQAIENTVKKLSALNKTLILLTKIENNLFSGNSVVDMNELIKKTLATFQDLIQLKNLVIESNFPGGFQVNFNPALAEILISNLLQNAIRHNYSGGKIVISTTQKALTISNSGDPLQIDPADLFVRFKKNDASKDSLGLGLAIVKSITDNYNCSINYNYENALHKFSVTFI